MIWFLIVRDILNHLIFLQQHILIIDGTLYEFIQCLLLHTWGCVNCMISCVIVMNGVLYIRQTLIWKLLNFRSNINYHTWVDGWSRNLINPICPCYDFIQHFNSKPFTIIKPNEGDKFTLIICYGFREFYNFPIPYNSLPIIVIR